MKKITLLLFLVFIGNAFAQYTYFGTDLSPASESGAPQDITSFNGKIYFGATFKRTASDGGTYYDQELGYYDPTDNSFGQFADINPSEINSGGSLPRHFFEFNGYLYFVASSGNSLTNRELYRTNGTTVELFKDIAIGNLSGFPQGSNPQFTIMNNKLYFFATSTGSGSDGSLWQTDGTTINTINVSTIYYTNFFDPSKNSVIVYNNELYFSGSDNLGAELYKYNDVSNTVSLVKDLYPGSNGSTPWDFTVFNNQLFFAAYTPSYGGKRHICKTDGTNAGTTDVLDAVTFSNNPNGLKVLNNQLVYVAFNPDTNYVDLYKCEYNLATSIYDISLIKHFDPGTVAPLLLISKLTLFNGELYFVAGQNSDYSNGNVRQIYKTNGTTSGTLKAITINASQIGTASIVLPRELFVFNGKLCFHMKDLDSAEQLWISDGTNNYLEKLTNIGNGLPIQPDITNYKVVSNNLYVNALSIYPYKGSELWRIEDTNVLSSGNFDRMNEILIYPNPTADIITIQSEKLLRFTVEIYDLIGKEIGTYKNQKTIDVSNLNSGIYLVKITDLDTNHTTSQKISKK